MTTNFLDKKPKNPQVLLPTINLFMYKLVNTPDSLESIKTLKCISMYKLYIGVYKYKFC